MAHYHFDPDGCLWRLLGHDAVALERLLLYGLTCPTALAANPVHYSSFCPSVVGSRGLFFPPQWPNGPHLCIALKWPPRRRTELATGSGVLTVLLLG